MGMPMNCQTEMRDKVASAVEGRPSQGANQPPRPIAFMNPSATPQSGERMRFQEKPMITTDSMVGRKMSVRYVARRRRAGRLRRPASATPMGFCTAIWMQNRRKLLKKAFQNGFDQTESVSNV